MNRPLVRSRDAGNRRRRSLLLAAATGTAAAAALLVGSAAPAAACGGLLGENGTIQLVRTTTVAAYHDGIEHYITGFQFTGEGAAVGSIVPLPGVPSSVEKGGDWTLQRLALEVNPIAEAATTAADDSGRAGAGVEVILETRIDALDITVVRGGGDEVGEWALDNGFLLPADAPEVLDFYAQRSPVFMAAKFDAEAARARGQQAGDATPIHVTIPTDEPWVPLRILALGLQPDERVEADVFLLTPERPDLMAGGPGLTLARSEAAGEFLLADLRSDRGMDWVPEDMWLTYMPLDASAGDLDYDLAVSTRPGEAPSLIDAGLTLPGNVPGTDDVLAARRIGDTTRAGGSTPPWVPVGIFAVLLGGFGVAAVALTSRERRASS
jgi:hypothetical protein